MKRYVAFLRGMNLGRRRIRNDELRSAFEAMGFGGVSVYLASGNVVFECDEARPARVVARIERSLCEALGYEVPTFLRTAGEVRAIAACEVFAEELVASRGKLQVALLAREPEEAARQAVLEMAGADDRLAFRGREMYWLPGGPLLESELKLSVVEGVLGPMTVRTRRTVERLAAKYLGG